MARGKKPKQVETPPKSDSPILSDSKETQEASPVPQHKPKRKAIAKVPQHARGRGRPIPDQGTSRGPRIKNASAPGSFPFLCCDISCHMHHVDICHTLHPTNAMI